MRRPGRPVRFRKSRGAHDPFVSTPHRGRRNAIELRACVDLVGQDPGSASRGDPRDPVELAGLQTHPGGVVRRADRDELGPRTGEPLELVEVGAPPRPVEPERPRVDLGPERFCRTPGLHVVRCHHHDAGAGLKERAEDTEVRLRAPVGDLHVFGCASGVERCDATAQFERTVGLHVAEIHGAERVGHAGHDGGELVQGRRVDAAPGEVHRDGVFVMRLVPLHQEG